MGGGVMTVTRVEEGIKERKGLQGGGPSSVTRGEKRKFEDSKPMATAKRVKKPYSAKEKADYKAKKAGERKVKQEGSVVPNREDKHRCGLKPRRASIKRLPTNKKKAMNAHCAE